MNEPTTVAELRYQMSLLPPYEYHPGQFPTGYVFADKWGRYFKLTTLMLNRGWFFLCGELLNNEFTQYSNEVRGDYPVWRRADNERISVSDWCAFPVYPAWSIFYGMAWGDAANIVIRNHSDFAPRPDVDR